MAQNNSVPATTSLYRQYRPTRLADLVGQDHIAAALSNALTSGRVSHAYLFSGPRGTGKTTTARVLAMALNCTDRDGVEPCGTCGSCQSIITGSSMDVSELDAASHNGVDAIRELTTRAALGSPGNRRVYIIDEVHMLSTAASNALLKTLEEPPAHVVFILATTDPMKVLPTVRSRTQHLTFALVGPAELTAHLTHVAGDAFLDVTDDQIAESVRKGNGSVRDALSALDAIAAGGGSIEAPHAATLTDALADGNLIATYTAIGAAAAAGTDARSLTEETLGLLRDLFIVAMGAPQLATTADPAMLAERSARIGAKRVVQIIEALGDAVVAMRTGRDARIELEVSAARLCRDVS